MDLPSGPFLIFVGGKALACEQCAVNLFRRQSKNNRMSPKEAVAVRCECTHCGEPLDVVIEPYRVSEDGRTRS